MQGTFVHWCVHVLDLEASLEFYEKALGLTPVRTMGPEDGSWSNTFLGNDRTPFQIELTWNRGRTEPYANGGRDTHICFTVPDFQAAYELHKGMGVIVRENPAMGLYFIDDPDGSWIEIIPEDR